ncbi:unnamed protein product [Paramecium octaurelia]|uniref:NEDD8-activating enzyme E1 regulatory subunit n=1 Tax=Paramecium octaurelia TaxID=43137 RepID=A0A8S1VNE7_PAROT|nr:unnamed protein product [Paramecium octaurelia]
MSSNDKYDRQVRIWGPHGQTKLQNARVLLLGCDPVGVETLKNLVLPGVGYVVIVDTKVVTEKDIENNFFIPHDTIGQSRAKVVFEYLLEMNQDVKGEWHQVENFDVKEQHYDLIIANEQQLLETKFNLIELQTYGFVGRMRLYSPKCHIIETKPMNQKYDLRIFNPFQELKEYFDSIEFEGDVDYVSHIPYIVILYKALQKYHKEKGKYPTTFSEKHKDFKQVILSLCEGLEYQYTGNFYEAIDNIDQAFDSENWKSSLESIEIEQDVNEDQYFVLISALRQFVQIHGAPPLGKAFPDMKCFTQTYVHLKNTLYGTKVEKDFQVFKTLCQNKVDDDTIRLFIENLQDLKSITFRTIQQELQQPNEVEDQDNDCYIWYILLRSVNEFYATNNRWPNQEKADTQQLQQIVEKQCRLVNVDSIPETHVIEICRYEGAKLHMIASVLGGMASQEAVKLITNQFVPINNTLIYDGLKSEASIFEF